MIALCPQCGRPITVDHPGWNVCRLCENRIWIPDPRSPDGEGAVSPPDEVVEEAPSAGGEDAGKAGGPPRLPWEERERYAAPRRFFHTLGIALFHPNRLFTALKELTDCRFAVSFGTLAMTIGLLAHFALQYASIAFFEAALAGGMLDANTAEIVKGMLDTLKSLHIDGGFFLATGILSPFFARFFIWFSGNLLITFSSFPVRESGAPFDQVRSVRTGVGYVFSPWILLPVLPLALLWWALMFGGFARRVLGFSLGRSLFAAFLNLVFLGFFYDFWVRGHVWLSSVL